MLKYKIIVQTKGNAVKIIKKQKGKTYMFTNQKDD